MTSAVSRETLRRILDAGKVSWKTTITWKASTDPDFIAKMQRVLVLYDIPPDDGRVICVDEFGPLNLMPCKGKAWGPVRRPRRLRMLAALGLATGKLYYRIRPRKRWCEFLGLLRVLCARWPGQKLYVVLDNFSPYKHSEVRTWIADSDVQLVFLPIYGSWLNWMEAEFAALRYFALGGTGHRSRNEQDAAVAAYVRWRNARAEPKTAFAPESSIRTWTEYSVRAVWPSST
ncbi:IS630 family transposase, partial [Streptomyces anandii]|uniref:IS630 family transposase n=1 Tax=Streptomyces anandii TaxID=285454 RepID=UPI001E542C0E